MEVHKPKLVANWRELLKEWGIIVLGVLTALFAEQVVQSFEWRHKVDATIADMDNELSAGDGPQAYARLTMHDCIANNLDAVEHAVESGERAASREAVEKLWLPNRTWDSLAREAATASDVSAHMPHERMLQYRIAYEMVPDMQRLAEKELVDVGHLRAVGASGGALETVEKLSARDAAEALKLDNDTFARESRFLLLRLRAMHLGLDRSFVQRDVAEAREHYGACITSPRLPSPGSPTSGPTLN